MKKLNLILITILIFDIAFAGYSWNLKINNVGAGLVPAREQGQPQGLPLQPQPESEPESKEIILMLVGDIMLSRGVGNKMAKEQDYKWPFLKIAEHLSKADLLFGNLEGPISDQGQDTGKKYSFRADPKTIEGLNYAGFDVLSIANNHIVDWGKTAKNDTVLRLKQNNILPVGFEEKPILEIQKTRIGFLAYTFGYKSEQVQKDIQELNADIKIVSMHIGDEYKKQSNSEQQNFAHAAIDAGADLVVGHHPHVTQEIEKYKDKFIFYSLGNFIFDQQFSDEVKNGWLAKIIIKDKKIISTETIKTKVSSQYQVDLNKEKQIKIDLSEQKLGLYENNNLIKNFIISSGASETPTPQGKFSISEKKKLLWSAKYQQYLPYALRFYGPYLIHEVPYDKNNIRDGLDQLGQPVSHGCIRLNIGDAEEVYNWAEIKTEVFVYD